MLPHAYIAATLLTAAACAWHCCFVAAAARCRFKTFAAAISHKDKHGLVGNPAARDETGCNVAKLNSPLNVLAG